MNERCFRCHSFTDCLLHPLAYVSMVLRLRIERRWSALQADAVTNLAISGCIESRCIVGETYTFNQLDKLRCMEGAKRIALGSLISRRWYSNLPTSIVTATVVALGLAAPAGFGPACHRLTGGCFTSQPRRNAIKCTDAT